MQKADTAKKPIYWERQGVDQLCGVHCINSLLQGPLYTEVDLGQVAQEIDAKERELLLSQGNTSEQNKYLKEDSNNVALDGNFSIQVLTEVLKKQALSTESIDSKENVQKDLSHEMGFICNSQSHWLSIRRIEDIWYNLNSTNRQGPEIISDFYLSAFLQSIKENGYVIFVVRGVYPEHDHTVKHAILRSKSFFSI